MCETVIEAHGLMAGYRKGKHVNIVLRDVDLRLQRGTLVSLLGANGTGKSTLLRTIAGTQPALGGKLKLCGRLSEECRHADRSRMVSIVSTDRTQAGGLTAWELVALGRHPHTGFMGRLDAHDRRVVSDSLVAVGMSHKKEHYVSELSDGERQKIMIAKALAQETPIIILDEPTAFLDVASRVEVLGLLHRLSREDDKAILLSSHDVSQSLALSDRLWLLYPDRTIADCMTEDAVLQGRMTGLFKSPLLKFDPLSGDYVSEPGGLIPVAVEGEPVAVRWCRNALRRNGYRVEVRSNVCRIVMESGNRIDLTVGGRCMSLASVEAVIDVLRELCPPDGVKEKKD